LPQAGHFASSIWVILHYLRIINKQSFDKEASIGKEIPEH
jgi:hypothetical protein